MRSQKSTWGLSILLVMLFMIYAAAGNPKKFDEKEYATVPFNLSFVPGISIGDAQADGRKVINRFSVNFIGSAARLHGAEIGWIWNAYSEDVMGAQYSGIGNSVGGEMSGIQYAGILNKVSGDVFGLQSAGIINLNLGNFNGLHWAGIINKVHGKTVGGQWAGIINLTQNEVTGVQFSGIYSHSGGQVIGGQWAGVMNNANGTLYGVQFAGIANIAKGDLHGAQFAGILNRAAVVHQGLQLGLVNISDSNNGVPVGLVSYVGDVGFRYDVWGSEAKFVHAGLRSGNRYIHNILFAGIQAENPSRWSLGWGIGGHIPLGDATFMEIDGLFSHINESSDQWTDQVNELATLRLLFGWQAARHLTFYAGPSYNAFISKDNDGSGLAPWTNSSDYDDEEQIWGRTWFGFNAGIRF